jgi:N-methylhydantoinase A/oxoprolinase/acetone carboxylase beta subunit
MYPHQTGLYLGVDVGGTNTDAVIVDGSSVVHWIKTPTTEDNTSGIVNSLERVLSESGVDRSEIEGVMVGTTHFTNAIVEARSLLPTAAIRLCGAATRGVPPLTDWPSELRAAVEGRTFMVDGGHEFDGRELAPLSRDQLGKVADEIRSHGIRSVALTSVFSPADDEHERRAAEILSESLNGVAFSLSSEIGSIGLLERENATIMNASLRGIADRIVRGLEDAVRNLGLSSPLYLSQNDGTLMGADYTNRYPVATFASGPTNSMRGAARLSQIKDCAVVDIGGTTSDIGILSDGFPREAPVAVEVAGVRTNFRMPDVHSIGIGGGSLVHTDGDVRVGPTSVGFRITEEALVFGGKTLTATDIAVAAGLSDVGDREKVRAIDKGLVQDALDWISNQIAEAIDRMKTGPDPIPVVVVGGGSIIATDDIPGASQVIRPPHHPVANAVGAAIAEVGGQIDRIVSLDDIPRADAIRQAKDEAVSRAIAAGAVGDTVRVVDVDEIPLAYLPSNAVRVKVKAIGQLGRPDATAD